MLPLGCQSFPNIHHCIPCQPIWFCVRGHVLNTIHFIHADAVTKVILVVIAYNIMVYTLYCLFMQLPLHFISSNMFVFQVVVNSILFSQYESIVTGGNANILYTYVHALGRLGSGKCKWHVTWCVTPCLLWDSCQFELWFKDMKLCTTWLLWCTYKAVMFCGCSADVVDVLMLLGMGCCVVSWTDIDHWVIRLFLIAMNKYLSDIWGVSFSCSPTSLYNYLYTLGVVPPWVGLPSLTGYLKCCGGMHILFVHTVQVLHNVLYICATMIINKCMCYMCAHYTYVHNDVQYCMSCNIA